LQPNYELEELQRIATSITYFEQAFDALVPQECRRNKWAKSNRQHSKSDIKDRDRFNFMTAIEETSTLLELFSLVQGTPDTNFCWNFLNLMNHENGIAGYRIEYRQAPASLTSEDALSWAELVMTFVQASIAYGTSKALSIYAPNITGLRAFLQKINMEGVNEPERWQRLEKARIQAKRSTGAWK
jgi:hypothetical protein